MALALRTKPHTNSWLYLSSRVCTLGEDAFEHAPAVTKKIHVYPKNLLNEKELAGGMMLQLDAICEHNFVGLVPGGRFDHNGTIRKI